MAYANHLVYSFYDMALFRLKICGIKPLFLLEEVLHKYLVRVIDKLALKLLCRLVGRDKRIKVVGMYNVRLLFYDRIGYSIVYALLAQKLFYGVSLPALIFGIYLCKINAAWYLFYLLFIISLALETNAGKLDIAV